MSQTGYTVVPPDLQHTQSVPGSSAPTETQPSNQPQSPFGPNNEQLPQPLQAALWDIIVGMEQEDDLPRRQEMRGIVQRRLFFRGQQYWWWDSQRALWYPPYEGAPGESQSQTQEPSFQHVTNIFQAYCLKHMAVLTQNNVDIQFYPQSAKNPLDVSTAKNASKVWELIRRNNNVESKNQDAAYFAWTDPMIATYTRFVSDAERYGNDVENVIEPLNVQLSPGMDSCPGCDYQQESQEGFGTCPDCGEQMQQNPPVMGQVPIVTGMQEIPKGQEVVDVIGSLNLRRSMWADRQDQFLYLSWVTDLHKATGKAMFPQVADSIESSGSGASSVDTYETLLRRILYLGYGNQTGYENTNLGTFRRTWLRNRSFESCTNDVIKEQLKTIFPDGCYVVFFNDTYCESRNESMDKKWVCKNLMPGEGQSRDAIGTALVPVQEQLNDACNLIFETAMFGVPEGFADQDVVDFEARASQGSLPAQLSPVKVKNGKSVQGSIVWSPPIEPGQAIIQYRDELMGAIAQLITGITPAIFGGDTGSNDTASGITIERNQALGVIGRAWRLEQEMWAQTALLGVQCFATYRSKDVEVAVLGDGGKWKPEMLALDDLKGSILAYPEVDQQYPILQSQVAALYSQLLIQPNEISMALMSNPENLEEVITKVGLTDLQVPGEDQREKTHRDIDQLLEGQPMAMPAPQMPGQPPMPPQQVPSLEPDPIIDDLSVAFKTCQEWLRSEAADTAKTDNPHGYLNVYLYAKACQQMGKAQELQNAIATQAVQGQGPAADLGGANDIAPPAPEGNEPEPASGPTNSA